MVEQLTVAEVLERAADLLTGPGVWGQCHCADTAIWSVGGISDANDQARIYFAKHIGGASHYDIWKWNDAPGRTQAEVVAKLREAAALAKATPATGGDNG